MRLIDISVPTSRLQTVLATLSDASDASMIVNHAENGRTEIRITASNEHAGMIIDRVQSVLDEDDNWRLVALPVEAACGPVAVAKRDKSESALSSGASREEIHQEVRSGARMSFDYFALAALSAILAALGMNTDNVAVVIGAMVIAPLLGPILAFSFGAALGDLQLMERAAKTAFFGILIGISVTYLMTFIVDVNLDSRELMSRTQIGPEIVGLALVSGAAAALSLVTGLSSTLVGVMVAVALLPPLSSVAMFLGAGRPELAAKAIILLAVNITCVTFASQVVFIAKGIRPRKWLDQKKAKKSWIINIVFWGALILILFALMLYINGADNRITEDLLDLTHALSSSRI